MFVDGVIVADMLSTLGNVNAEEIVLRKRNSLAVDTDKFDCDFYNFQNGDIHAINFYAGNYMSATVWLNLL